MTLTCIWIGSFGVLAVIRSSTSIVLRRNNALCGRGRCFASIFPSPAESNVLSSPPPNCAKCTSSHVPEAARDCRASVTSHSRLPSLRPAWGSFDSAAKLVQGRSWLTCELYRNRKDATARLPWHPCRWMEPGGGRAAAELANRVFDLRCVREWLAPTAAPLSFLNSYAGLS